MAFPADFHMPGAYHFDPAAPSSQPLSATVFRPPMSPSASSSIYNLAKSTGSLYSDVSMANTPCAGAKRKRARPEPSRASTPNADWNMNMDGAGDVRDEEKPSAGADAGADATEIRYTLAGQIDTPGGAPTSSQDGILGGSAYSDIDYRRALGSKRQRDELESPSIQFSALRLETPAPVTPHPVGWSTLALSTIGGVVGKVWDFCKKGGFRGFQAGGGDRYGPSGICTPTKGGEPWCNEHDIPTLETDGRSPSPLNEHIPGGFPQSEYVSLHELSTPDSTPRPAVKRRQTSATHGDELRRNWVLVDEPSPSAPAAPSEANSLRPASAASFTKPSRTSTAASRPSLTRSRPNQPRYSTPTATSSSRRISVPVSRLGATPSSTAFRARPSLRISHAGSPALSGGQPASYAAPRSPQTGHPSSPSCIPVATFATRPSAPNPFAIPGTATAAASAIPSPSRSRQQQRSASRCASPAPLKAGGHAPGHHRRAVSSAASPARLLKQPAAAPDDGAVIRDSPRLTTEAKQLAASKRAAERDADAKMEALNRRLMDMIRQGKEALGTTVEVEMEYGAPTAGWEDDD